MEQVGAGGEVPQVLSIGDAEQLARRVPAVQKHVLEGPYSQNRIAVIEDRHTGSQVPQPEERQHHGKDKSDTDGQSTHFGTENPSTGSDDALGALVDPVHSP